MQSSNVLCPIVNVQRAYLSVCMGEADLLRNEWLYQKLDSSYPEPPKAEESESDPIVRPQTNLDSCSFEDFLLNLGKHSQPILTHLAQAGLKWLHESNRTQTKQKGSCFYPYVVPWWQNTMWPMAHFMAFTLCNLQIQQKIGLSNQFLPPYTFKRERAFGENWNRPRSSCSASNTSAIRPWLRRQHKMICFDACCLW